MTMALAVLGAACGKSSDASDAGAAAASAFAPLPAPEGLIAEGFVPAPDATWAKVRGIIGGPAAFLPQSFGGLVASFLGLPVTVAPEVDGGVPVLGALVGGPPSGDAGAGSSRPRAVIAVHVKEGTRLIDQLTKGEAPRFTARSDPATNITVLDPRDKAKAPATLGVLQNYLLIGVTEADLTAAGPYVVRTLSRATPPPEDVTIQLPETAMAGPVRAWIAQATRMLRDDAERAGATLGMAVAPVLAIAEVLSDVKSARVTVQLDADALRMRSTLVPGAGASRRALDEMSTGDAAPLRSLPDASVAAILLREPSASRLASADRQAAALVALLGDVPPKERDAFGAALRDLAAARGEWFAGGLSFGATGPAVHVRAAVADKEKLRAAMKSLGSVASQGSFKTLLANFGLGVSVGKTKVDGVEGDIERLRFERAKSKTQAEPWLPAAVDLLHTVRDDMLFIGAGLDAKAALSSTVAPPGTLEKSVLLDATLRDLGPNVALALLVEPLLLVASRAGKPGGAESAPVVLSLGKSTDTGATLWLRLDVANAAMRELIKNRGALFGP